MYTGCEFKRFLTVSIRMANERISITVPLDKGLRDSLNKVAKAHDQSAAQFVRGMLTKKIRTLLPLVEKMREYEAKIREAYDSDDEDGQGAVRRSSPPDAKQVTKEKRKDKG